MILTDIVRWSGTDARWDRDADYFFLKSLADCGAYWWWVSKEWLETGYRRRHWRVLAVNATSEHYMVEKRAHPFWKRRR